MIRNAYISRFKIQDAILLAEERLLLVECQIEENYCENEYGFLFGVESQEPNGAVGILPKRSEKLGHENN